MMSRRSMLQLSFWKYDRKSQNRLISVNKRTPHNEWLNSSTYRTERVLHEWPISGRRNHLRYGPQSMVNNEKQRFRKQNHGFISLFTFTGWRHSNINHPLLHTNHSTNCTIREQTQHVEYKIQFQQLLLLPQLRMETCRHCGYSLYNLRLICRGIVVGSWRFIAANRGQWYCCALSVRAPSFRYFHVKSTWAYTFSLKNKWNFFFPLKTNPRLITALTKRPFSPILDQVNSTIGCY